MDREAGLAAALEQVRALLELGREQESALGTGDLERYDALLGQREALVGELGVGDEARERLLVASVERASDADRGALLRALQELAEIDGRCETLVEAQARTIREALPTIEAGRRAAAAYHTARPRAAYVDAAS